MNDVLDTFNQQTLPVIAITNELKTFFTLRKIDSDLYPTIIKKIENIIQILEQENISSFELLQAIKDLDDLISVIKKPVTISTRVLENALDDLRRFG